MWWNSSWAISNPERWCCESAVLKFGKLSSGHRKGKRSVFIPISKKGNPKECSNYLTIALISHASKVMLKILQAGFSKTWTINFQMFKLLLEKAKHYNIHRIIEKAREFQKSIYFCFTDYAKAFDCVYHNKLWKILKEMTHLTHLLRNLYVGQEATVRTRHGPTDWFQIGKGSTSRLYIVILLI